MKYGKTECGKKGDGWKNYIYYVSDFKTPEEKEYERVIAAGVHQAPEVPDFNNPLTSILESGFVRFDFEFKNKARTNSLKGTEDSENKSHVHDLP